MKRRWVDGLSAFGAGSVVLAALFGCKSNKTEETPTVVAAATETVTAAATETAAPDSATAPTTTTTATSAPTHAGVANGKADIISPIGGTDCPGDYAGPLPPENKCHKRCSGNGDCKSNNCMAVQNTKMCMATGMVDDSNGPPEGYVAPTATAAPAKQTVGVTFKGDCPDGWNPSTSEENKCDKECKTDAECGAGNKCKAVGPIESGKQCQRG